MSKMTLVFPIVTLAFIALVFTEYIPLLRRGVPTVERGAARWNKTDSLLCVLITLVYAVTAFAGLGSFSAPQSYCKFQERGQYARFELAEETYITNIRYFSGLKTGTYYIQFSADGEDWTDVGTMDQKFSKLFKWLDAELEEERPAARYIQIIADSPLWLAEIALYDASGELIDPATIDYPSPCAVLFDEQDTVPERSNYLNSSYFDEIYHARTALEHIQGIKPYEISHPPLGKLILSIGISLFGMVPFGWRAMGTLFGVLMLPALYYFLRRMFGSSSVAACGTAIFAFDFMHFVQTRIATIDTYAVFFIILMYLFMYLYTTADRENKKASLVPLALSGLCFGLGAASKWTCIYAGGGLAVIWLIDRVERALELKRAGEPFMDDLLENVGCCLVFFVAVPCLVYYLSYAPYGIAEGMRAPGMFFTRDYFDIVVGNQKYMFSYHSGVHSEHPYSSDWWQWILNIRPILYYLEYFDDGTKSSFGAFVNPMLCWGGLAAMVSMVWLTFARRDKTARFILIGYLAQLLPWTIVGRVVFEYHYFPSAVFLLLAICRMFSYLRAHHSSWRAVMGSFTGVSLLLFIVFYPVLSGLRVSSNYTHLFLKWFSSWPF